MNRTSQCVRDVRDGVRADVRAQTLAAVGVCGMCGHFCSHAQARTRFPDSLTCLTYSRACMQSRTSRTSRTAQVLQGIRQDATPHTAPHSPHTLARARFSVSLATERKDEGVNRHD